MKSFLVKRIVALILLCTMLCGCASWMTKDSRWYTEDEMAACDSDVVDPAQFRPDVFPNHMGIRGQRYQEIVTAWYRCHKATLAVARDNKNRLEYNRKFQQTWIPTVQNVVEVSGYLFIFCAIVIVANPPAGLALSAILFVP